MMPSSPGPLLNRLPAIYHTSEHLRTILSTFEAVLFGKDEEDPNEKRQWRFPHEGMPLASSIKNIASLFDAFQTPTEFLPWLAQWVALTHLEGLTEERQRQLLAKIVPLYAQRGTKIYLMKLLAFFTPENATVSIQDQELPGFVVGTARIGLSSWLERDRPFWFEVEITTPAPTGDAEMQRALRDQWEPGVRRVIDLAKPAPTLYELHWRFA